MLRTHPWTAAVVVFVLVIAGTGVAAGAVEITDLTAPGSATTGDTVTVTAQGYSDEDNPQQVTISLFRMDTKEKLCTDSGTSPVEVSCSATLEMPANDVRLRTYIEYGGRIVEDKYATITHTTSSDDGNSGGGATPTPTPVSIGGGEVREERPLPSEYTVNDSTSLVESTDSTSSSGDGGGLLGDVIGGLTETAKNGFVTVLKDFVTSSALDILTTLIKSVAVILSWAPDVYPNPAVEEVHQLTVTVTFAFASLAVAITGLLYQVGPVLGISYRQTRMLLPRIIIALAFGLISLPLLQLSVDLANALTVAFTPDMLDASLGEMIGTATASIIALLIQATTLVAVAAAYLIADVYLLFIAAISPLIALAWAMPRTQRYAAAFIGGWWTALAMGPLAMLVLRFTFALMHGGASFGQGIANWLYGVAAFVLLLIVPYQLYGASQTFTQQAFHLTQGAERRARKEYRRRSMSGGDDTRPRTGYGSNGQGNSTVDAVNDIGSGTALPQNWRQQQIAEQPWNHPAARDRYNPDTHGVEHRGYMRSDPGNANGQLDNLDIDYFDQEPDTEPRGHDPDTADDANGGEQL